MPQLFYTDFKPREETSNFQTMLQYIEPLAAEVCSNLLLRETCLATKNLDYIDREELMNLMNVNDLWTNKVMGLLQDVRETSIDD